MKKSEKLRELFKKDKIIKIVGAHDGLGAKLVERNGFDGVWASGLEISTSFAVPDSSILTMSQYLERSCEMNESITIPVVADCDTGYGNTNNVIHMVKKYEAANIAAVCIEDKLFPKMNSFVPGKQELASIAEFVGKIMAAKSAQEDENFMVFARVEALIAGWGIDEAIKRANAYVDASADAILIHSKAKDISEIKEFCRRWNKRAPLIVVPTTYPLPHVEEMAEMGIKMIIYANHCIRAAIKAVNKVLKVIKSGKNLKTIDKSIVSMNTVFELQGMSRLKEADKLYLKKELSDIKVIIPAAGDPSYEESLEDIVKDYPIAILDINGKSILQRNVETLSRLRLYDITVITGYNSEKFKLEGVTYLNNADFENTSLVDSIMLVRDSLNSRTLIIFSDVLFEKSIIKKLLHTSSDIVLLMNSSMPRKDSSIDYIVAKKDPIKGERKMFQEKENEILQIGKDMDPQKAKFEYIGISYFSKKGIAIFKDAYRQQKSKIELPEQRKHFLQIIQKIIDKGVSVYGIEVNSGWIEIRNFENYKLAHSFFMDM